MKPWKRWWICPLMIFCGILFPGLARADGIMSDTEWAYARTYGAGAICPTIADYPSEAGVIGVGQAIQEDGFSADSAVDILNYSVSTYCPELFPLLQQIGRRARHEMAV